MNLQQSSFSTRDSFVDERLSTQFHHSLPSSVTSQQGPLYQSISHSLPVERPRLETAHSYKENPSYHYQQFYSIEEHHDDFSIRPIPEQSGDFRKLSTAIPGTSNNCFNKRVKDLVHVEEVDLLLASHSHPSFNLQLPYNDREGKDFVNSKRLNFPNCTEQTDQFTLEIEKSDHHYRKPQIYRTYDRKVDRITYHPTGNQNVYNVYPIVEVSLPKETAIYEEESFIDVPYIDQETSSIAKSKFHSRNSLRNGFGTNNQSVQFQLNTNTSHCATLVNTALHEYSHRGEQKTIQNTSVASTQSIDCSSLDAFLDGSLLTEENMSKSTKEWQSSFSTMRDRFGCMPVASNESLSKVYDFSTSGSVTLPRQTLSKSASQGSLTVRRQMNPSTRQRSLHVNVIEQNPVAEASTPDFQRQAYRRELGDFWTETLKNRSATQRTLAPLTAAQRLEVLHESMNDGACRSSRRFSGETLATRKANFLKEAVKSATSLMDRVITGRLTPNPAPINEKSTIDGEIKENNLARSINEPNFAALDSAVAELSNSNYGRIQNNGCAKFPTDDLSTISSINKRVSGPLSINGPLHSPSPEAISDTSSSYSTPTGLPHPKPKHNIREQLIQAGFEPRGSSIYYVNRSGVRFGSAPNFPIPSSGSVASRISEFEKKPGAPNLLQLACALNATEQQRNEASSIRSPSGPMSPRSTIYRTKPVIHADISGAGSRASQTPVNSGTIFEFPPAKQLTDTEDNISYCNADNSTSNGHVKNTESLSSSEIILETPVNRRAKTNDKNESSKSSLSIAERRLEKKKGVAKLSINNSNNTTTILNIPQQNGIEIESKQPISSSVTKLPTVNVPRFFFPKGVPIPMAENEAALRRVSDIFSTIGNKAGIIDMAEICRAAGIPIYWKRAVYDSCCNYQSRPITLIDFASWWNRMTSVAHDEAARFVYTLAGPHRNYLIKEDFTSILQDLIETFPGLHFLREAQEFHARYVETVTVRIFWAVNRSWSGKITTNELRRSNFLETVRKLETTDDINAITNYFSYEHFYVIYCKFYELDKDHDLIIDKTDMSQHGNGALPPQIIDRIFSGAVTRASSTGRIFHETLETIGYTDFVAFLLAEEDKRHPTSVEYWFRCLDLDGDGLLSLYEMEFFYNGVKSKMDQHNIDSMRFDDVVCNLLDLIRPRQPNAISLSDLKKCPLCTRFFNTFVNWVKYYEQEASEGERATVTDGEEELSDWDRYCLEEYEALMADDQENDEPEDINLNLDDDDDLLNGMNLSTAVGMSLRDFGDSSRTKILEAV